MSNNPQSLKPIDLLMGVRTEQSLRDAVREYNEAHPEDACVELCPVGAKDWVAGERLGPRVRFGDLADMQRRVLGKLNGLRSHQRIRSENIRIYAVRPQVPVFHEVLDEPSTETKEALPETSSPDTLICPVCLAEVHRYNIQCDPSGAPVGCYLCRGDARRRR